MLSSGSSEIAQRLSEILTSLKPTELFLKAREAFSWDETSQTIVRFPRFAAASPRAIATVDLPTPPLPITKTSRLSNRSGTVIRANSPNTEKETARCVRNSRSDVSIRPEQESSEDG